MALRRRERRHLRADHVTRYQRFGVVSGRFSPSVWESEDDYRDACEVLRDALLDEIEDPAADFEGFWRLDPEVPDELRDCPGRYDHVLLPDGMAAETKAERTTILERRRAWLGQAGYR